jgi:glycosyltransferase involved in cell wall biosynthesis
MKHRTSLISESPIISVVIPAYNEQDFLGPCLKTLQYQSTDIEYEVIVVDNNSSDNTAKVAEEYGARVVYQPIQGVCAARQAGTEAAKGEIVISTDADATFHPDYLTNVMKKFAERPDASAIAGTPFYVDAPLWIFIYKPPLFAFSWIVYKITGSAGYISACNTAFKKKYWTGYNTALTQGGDEFGLLKQLKPKGHVVLDLNNPVNTSSRRLQRGFLYNFFVTLLTYYVLDYLLSKLSGRSMFGSAPAFRNKTDQVLQKRNVQVGLLMLLLIGVSFYYWHHNQQINEQFETRIHTLEQRVKSIKPRRK